MCLTKSKDRARSKPKCNILWGKMWHGKKLQPIEYRRTDANPNTTFDWNETGGDRGGVEAFGINAVP